MELGFLFIPLACCPFFNDQYCPAKWGIVYLMICVFVMSYLISKSRVSFFNDQKVIILIVLLLSQYLIGAVTYPGAYENQILDWISFICLFYLAYQIETQEISKCLKNLSFWIIASTVLVILFGFTQILHWNIFPSLLRNEFPSSFFGFQNMTAEFIGISIIFQEYLRTLELKNKKQTFNRVLLTGLQCLSVCYLFILQCRSVILALVIVSLFPLFFGKPRRIFLLALMMAGVLLNYSVKFDIHFVPIQHESQWNSSLLISPLDNNQALLDVKKGNIQTRISRWKNTLQIIEDHPFGIGPGNYEFLYPLYHSKEEKDVELTEYNLVRSPHNGYLTVLVQNGIPFFITFVLLVGLLFKRGWSLLRSQNYRLCPEMMLISSGLIFIFIDAIFAFPMEMAFPFYCTAILCGFYFRKVFPIISFSDSVRGRMTKVILCSFLFYIGDVGLVFLHSKWVEGARVDDYSNVEFSCRMFPSNWRVCLRKARLEMEQGNYFEAEKTAKEMLSFHPDFYPTLAVLTPALFLQGKHKEGCEIAKRYDSIFDSASSFHEDNLRFCSSQSDKRL